MYMENEGSAKKKVSTPIRLRRRQSDARWRANVASCYETLKYIIPMNKRTSKKQISKALVLQETSKHICFLEGILETLLPEKAEKMNAMVAEGNLDFLCHAEPQTLDDIKQDFIRKQEYKQKLEIAMKAKRRLKKPRCKMVLPMAVSKSRGGNQQDQLVPQSPKRGGGGTPSSSIMLKTQQQLLRKLKAPKIEAPGLKLQPQQHHENILNKTGSSALTAAHSKLARVLQEPAKVQVRGRKSQHTKKLQKTLAEVASQRKHQIATAVSSFPAVRRINVKSKKKSSSRQSSKSSSRSGSQELSSQELPVLAASTPQKVNSSDQTPFNKTPRKARSYVKQGAKKKSNSSSSSSSGRRENSSTDNHATPNKPIQSAGADQTPEGFTPVKLPKDWFLTPTKPTPLLDFATPKTEDESVDLDDDTRSLLCLESMETMDLDNEFEESLAECSQIVPWMDDEDVPPFFGDICEKTPSGGVAVKLEACSSIAADQTVPGSTASPTKTTRNCSPRLPVSSRHQDLSVSPSQSRTPPKCRKDLKQLFAGLEGESVSQATSEGKIAGVDGTREFDGYLLFYKQAVSQLEKYMDPESVRTPTLASMISHMWTQMPEETRRTMVTMAIMEDSESSETHLSEDLKDIPVAPIAHAIKTIEGQYEDEIAVRVISDLLESNDGTKTSGATYESDEQGKSDANVGWDLESLIECKVDLNATDEASTYNQEDEFITTSFFEEDSVVPDLAENLPTDSEYSFLESRRVADSKTGLKVQEQGEVDQQSEDVECLQGESWLSEPAFITIN